MTKTTLCSIPYRRDRSAQQRSIRIRKMSECLHGYNIVFHTITIYLLRTSTDRVYMAIVYRDLKLYDHNPQNLNII